MKYLALGLGHILHSIILLLLLVSSLRAPGFSSWGGKLAPSSHICHNSLAASPEPVLLRTGDHSLPPLLRAPFIFPGGVCSLSKHAFCFLISHQIIGTGHVSDGFSLFTTLQLPPSGPHALKLPSQTPHSTSRQMCDPVLCHSLSALLNSLQYSCPLWLVWDTTGAQSLP